MIPELVGAKVAAEILGVHDSYIARLCRDGRLKPVPVEGAQGDAYVKADVEALAATMNEQRQHRRNSGRSSI